MSDRTDTNRRRFLQTAGAGAAALAATGLGLLDTAQAQTAPMPSESVSSGVAIPMGPIRHVHADVLDIGYHEAGPSGGQVVLLLHGYPYDIHSYVDVAPMLAAQGYRVIVPYLRGHGSTRFLDAATPRAGQQGAIGADVIALMDALKISTAVFAGFDWGGCGLRRGGAVAGAPQGPGVRQQLPHSGHRPCDDAHPGDDRVRPVVPVLLSDRARPGGTGGRPARRRSGDLDAQLPVLAL
jgi:hypothetical protein